MELHVLGIKDTKIIFMWQAGIPSILKYYAKETAIIAIFVQNSRLYHREVCEVTNKINQIVSASY